MTSVTSMATTRPNFFAAPEQGPDDPPSNDDLVKDWVTRRRGELQDSVADAQSSLDEIRPSITKPWKLWTGIGAASFGATAGLVVAPTIFKSVFGQRFNIDAKFNAMAGCFLVGGAIAGLAGYKLLGPAAANVFKGNTIERKENEAKVELQNAIDRLKMFENRYPEN